MDYFVAPIIARIPALIAGGKDGQAAMTTASSGSEFPAFSERAPDCAPLWVLGGGFPEKTGLGSSPAWPMPQFCTVSRESAEPSKTGAFLCAGGFACDSVRPSACTCCAAFCAAVPPDEFSMFWLACYKSSRECASITFAISFGEEIPVCPGLETWLCPAMFDARPEVV